MASPGQSRSVAEAAGNTSYLPDPSPSPPSTMNAHGKNPAAETAESPVVNIKRRRISNSPRRSESPNSQNAGVNFMTDSLLGSDIEMSNAPTISPLTRQAPFFSSPLNTPDISRFYSPSIKRPSPTTKEPEEEPTLRTKRRKTSSSDGESSVITVRRRSNNDSSNDAAPIFKPSEMQITNSIERGDSQEEPNSKIERAIALGSTAVAQVDSPGPERVMAETIQNRSLKGQPINDITSLEGQAQGVGNNDTRRDAEIAGVSNSGISGFDEQQNQQLNGEVPASTAALTARPARCQAQKPNKEQCKNKAASAKCFGNSGNDEAKVSLARFCRVHQKVEIRKAQKKPPATAANTKKKRAAKPAPVTTAERKIWAGAAAKGQPKQPEIQPASAPRTRRSNEKTFSMLDSHDKQLDQDAGKFF